MINIFRKKSPTIRFFSLSPGVNTLYPIIKSGKLDRQWISEEKKDYENRKSKCPFASILNGNLPIGGVHSVGKCPAIQNIMSSGFIVRAPADFSVQTNGDGSSVNLRYRNILPHIEYVTKHEEEVSSWLLDSSKDVTLKQVIKINTPWRIVCDSDDIVFLVTKVPFVKEPRFTAVMGILDPKTAYEINIQLFWHVLDGEEVIKAGTPLCNYIPVSRSLLQSINFTSEDATEIDYNVEREMTFSYDHVFPNLNTITDRISRVKKILKKYYG